MRLQTGVVVVTRISRRVAVVHMKWGTYGMMDIWDIIRMRNLDGGVWRGREERR